MEEPGRFPNSTESDTAEQLYEQALVLGNLGNIPEAVKLLKKANKLQPKCELYRETLALLEMNFTWSPDQEERTGARYANVGKSRSTPKQSFVAGNDDWNEKITRVREKPNGTSFHSPHSWSGYRDVTEPTIDNPWTSFVERKSRRCKPNGSPVDTITEIEVPPGNEDTFSPTPANTKKTKRNGDNFIPSSKENCSNLPGDRSRLGNVDGDILADGSSDSLDRTFIEELCKARESIGDDWTEYYDLLLSLLNEQTTNPSSKDFSHQDSHSSQERNSGLDNLENSKGVRSESDPATQFPSSQKSASSVPADKLCSKCGNVQSSSVKNRVHFVNGACVSSSSAPKCTCSKPDKEQSNRTSRENVSETKPKTSGKSDLTSSEEEFYRNLQYYFGSGRVKSKKAPVGEGKGRDKVKGSSLPEEEAYSGTQHIHVDKPNGPSVSSSKQKSESSEHASKRPMKGSKQDREYVRCDTASDKTHSEPCKTQGSVSAKGAKDKETSFDHCSHDHKSKKGGDDSKVKSAFKQDSDCGTGEHVRCDEASDKTHSEPCKTQASVSRKGAKDKETSFDHCSHDHKSKKGGDDSKVKNACKTKVQVKGQHSKSAKDSTKQRVDSQGKIPKPKGNVRTRPTASLRGIPRPSPFTDSTNRHDQKEGDEGMDFTELSHWLRDSGKDLLVRCGLAVKSVLVYTLLLIMLVLGSILYCIWFAGCWMYEKGLEYIPVHKWLTAARTKVLGWYDWFRKLREPRRKNSGQTYDLPKSGDAAVRQMLFNKDNEDPYRVLGVPSDASDDEIRRQYRKLAVLIHPDKNSHPHADEAFKILANSFDILGDPEKRQAYDREVAWREQVHEREQHGSYPPNSPEQFFADLGRKMQEMQNYLHCDVCDGKHRRYSTDRFMLAARFCSRCGMRHPAKEGDLWGESSYLGYKVFFYACMEGEIFDVTEWAACQGIDRYHVEMNPHTATLKLKTRHSHPQPRGFHSRAEDEEFENFMRSFFGQFPFEEEKHAGPNKTRKKKRKRKR